jgi:hypothetical protein
MNKKFLIEERRNNIYKYHRFYGDSLSQMVDRLIKEDGKFDILKIEEVVEDVSEGRAYTS